MDSPPLDSDGLVNIDVVKVPAGSDGLVRIAVETVLGVLGCVRIVDSVDCADANAASATSERVIECIVDFVIRDRLSGAKC